MAKLTSQDCDPGKHKAEAGLALHAAETPQNLDHVSAFCFPQTPENTGWCYKISRLQMVCDKKNEIFKTLIYLCLSSNYVFYLCSMCSTINVTDSKQCYFYFICQVFLTYTCISSRINFFSI